MKIKQLSLCVLTAFALMACGGGDSQPTVKATAKPAETTNKKPEETTNKKPEETTNEKPEETTNEKPEETTNEKPKTHEIKPINEVPENLQAAVKEAKVLAASSSTSDSWKSTTSELTIEGKTYDTKGDHDLSGVTNGKTAYFIPQFSAKEVGGDAEEKVDGTYTGQALVYNLPYSLMAGYLPLDFKGKYIVNKKELTTAELKEEGEISIFTVDRIAGYGTTNIAGLPTATYQGKAFAQNGNTISDAGVLSYTIDFANKKGHGDIQSLPGGNWDLKEAPLTNHTDSFLKGANYTIRGNAAMRGSEKPFLYNLGLYGPEAEGIMGVIHEKDRNGEAIVGFGGEKQK